MVMVLKKLGWQIVPVCLSAFIFAEVVNRNIYRPLFWVAEYTNSYDSYFDLLSWLDNSPIKLRAFLFCLWVSVYVLAVFLVKSLTPLTSKLLLHLRYAPLMSFVFFLVTMIAYDNLMIECSKYQLRKYIRNSTYSYQYPMEHLNLYNNYRGQCGNAAMGYYIWLYGETVIKEFDSSNPEVRLRALQTSIDLYTWEGSCEKPFITLLEKASQDTSLSVKTLVQRYIANSSSDCIKKQ
ncbi:MAG: hypothetical protein HY819_25215 [Acidobacteria bacterium]|nr:hypothetical protein [Acidobacteriota bacterium]